MHSTYKWYVCKEFPHVESQITVRTAKVTKQATCFHWVLPRGFGCGKLHLSFPSSWLLMWPWAGNSAGPQITGQKLSSHSKSFTDFVYLLCVLIRTDAAPHSVFVQQVANRDPALVWRSQVTHQAVRNVRMYLPNRNKNNYNLCLASTSALKNLKQSIKQFDNTLDMHGWHVFLYGFSKLYLT